MTNQSALNAKLRLVTQSVAIVYKRNWEESQDHKIQLKEKMKMKRKMTMKPKDLQDLEIRERTNAVAAVMVYRIMRVRVTAS